MKSGAFRWLGLLAVVGVASWLVQLESSAFRHRFEDRLVGTADRVSRTVDSALGDYSRALQERLIESSRNPNPLQALAQEIEALREQGRYRQLVVMDSRGERLVPEPKSARRGDRQIPPFEAALRRTGLLHSSGLEIRQLQVTPRGAQVIVGLGETGFLAGYMLPNRLLFEQVDALVAESNHRAPNHRGVGILVVNTEGEILHSTSRSEPSFLHFASISLSSFPGWRLAAFPSTATVETLVRRRLYATSGVALLLVLIAFLAWRPGAVRRRPADEGVAGDPVDTESIRLGSARVRLESYEVDRDGEVFALSVRETELLEFLLERRGAVVRREDLLERVWGYRDTVETRTLDTFIYRLRRKIEHDPAAPKHLLTVRGVGYKLTLE